jgi:hypothetical protein
MVKAVVRPLERSNSSFQSAIAKLAYVPVVKISPDGQIIGEVLLPTRNVTCTQFVGTQLFVTSGEDTDGDGESRNYGGGLFCVDVGVEGLQPFCFQMARQEDATTVDGA